MSKFKVGDRVRVVKGHDNAGFIGTILDIPNANGTYSGYVFSDDEDKRMPNPNNNVFHEDELELVTNNEGEKTMRRTFKLLKDTPGVNKGALYQERCDDGDQPYDLISLDSRKGSNKDLIGFEDRTLVEDAPEWFVEVFKVEPEYMTREELDRYHVFLKGKKPTKAVKPVKAQRAPWSAERRRRFEKTQKAKRG